MNFYTDSQVEFNYSSVFLPFNHNWEYSEKNSELKNKYQRFWWNSNRSQISILSHWINKDMFVHFENSILKILSLVFCFSVKGFSRLKVKGESFCCVENKLSWRVFFFSNVKCSWETKGNWKIGRSRTNKNGSLSHIFLNGF